jgi:hypothetical protein
MSFNPPRLSEGHSTNSSCGYQVFLLAISITRLKMPMDVPIFQASMNQAMKGSSLKPNFGHLLPKTSLPNTLKG